MISQIETCCKRPAFNGEARREMVDSGSFPVTGPSITSMDLDVTVRCNLACDYCFKEKDRREMSLETARDAVCWLIFASMDARRLQVNFMGGEPLLRFDLIKQLVPFAKRRASQHNKFIHFGVTTNGTIMSDEIIEFWRRWGLGFHTSIDGCPEAHNLHRHFADGRPTSFLLERNLPKILAVRPLTTARATVLPDTIRYLPESFEYILNMGYKNIAFVPGSYPQWDKTAVKEFGRQFGIISQRVMELMRSGKLIKLKFFDEGCAALAKGQTPKPGRQACGAGRGMALVDVNGDIWPCHRWSKNSEIDWRLGSIYEPSFNYQSRGLINTPVPEEELDACRKCPALFLCLGGCPAENLEDTGRIFKRHPIGCAIAQVLAKLIREFHDTMFAEKNPVFMETYYKNLVKNKRRESK
jgi:uncharacterized protein